MAAPAANRTIVRRTRDVRAIALIHRYAFAHEHAFLNSIVEEK